MNTSALIGYTGFIGSSFKRHFDYKINSKTVLEKKIDVSELVICAPSGLKWKANKQPSEDRLSCKKLYSLITDKFENLKRIILISSNDTLEPTCPYGENRKEFNDLLEKYCNENKIELYREGIDPTNEVGNEMIKECSVEFTSNEVDLRKAKFHIVAVPTPVNDDHTPDLLPVEGAI